MIPYSGLAQAGVGPRFDREATTVQTRGDGVNLVRFTEIGLPPGQRVNILVSVTVTTETSCVVVSTGEILFRTSSSAAASAAEPRTADAEGKIEGEQTLLAKPGAVDVHDVGCEVREHTTAEATVVDQDNSVRITVTS